MTWTVSVIFDHMVVDETYHFEKEGEAAKCKADLERKYRGQRLYSIKMEEVE
ncbi:DUF7204 family protein [Streptococcus merionis]|uniref:DUF7204 family protein n=1 Tax=Streptococcus merionis TaxID=400065 RepID=UPI0035179D3D